MCCTPCSEAGWRTLAGLPKLQSVLLGGLALGEAPACGVTRLVLAGEPLALALPRAALPGCLARQLPRLQELRAGGCELQQLCAALRDHPALRALEAAGGAAGGGAPWPRGALASLPALAQLRLRARAGDDLLVEVCACEALTSLGLLLAGSSPGGRAALGAARCAPLLRELQLEDCERPLGASEAAALLGSGGLPRLGRARLALALPPAAAAAAPPQAAAQQVEALLRREGLPPGLACSCSWSSLPRQHRASGGWYASCVLELSTPGAGG
jgi:hypothetical protein